MVSAGSETMDCDRAAGCRYRSFRSGGWRGQDVVGAVACELSGCAGRSAGHRARCRKPARLRPWDARRLDFLVLAVPLTQAAMQLDERLYWLLALGILILYGPGPFALDRLVDQGLRRVDRDAALDDTRLPHVVIVGGGFGGIAAARGLACAACRITLVDRRNYHLFQPLLYQVATAGLWLADIATPIRSLFRLQPNVRVLLGEVVGVRPASREIVIGRNSLRYDYLVLATGAQHSYFGMDDWAANAPGLKTIEDAIEVRRRLSSPRSNGPKAQMIQRSAQHG